MAPSRRDGRAPRRHRAGRVDGSATYDGGHGAAAYGRTRSGSPRRRTEPRRGHRRPPAPLPDLDGHPHALLRRRRRSPAGWLRWVLVAGAVLLPYVAVVIANTDRASRPTASRCSTTRIADGPTPRRAVPTPSARPVRRAPRPAAVPDRRGVGACESSTSSAMPDRRAPGCSPPWLRPRRRRRAPRDAAPGRHGEPSDVAPPPVDRRAARSAADGRHRAVGLEERRVVDAVPGQLARHRDAPSGRRARRRSAPARSGARRSDSSRANRQLRTWPSAVSRTRSQSPQNGPGHRRDDADRGRAAVDRRTARPGRCPAARAAGVSANSRSQRARGSPRR